MKSHHTNTLAIIAKKDGTVFSQYRFAAAGKLVPRFEAPEEGSFRPCVFTTLDAAVMTHKELLQLGHDCMLKTYELVAIQYGGTK